MVIRRLSKSDPARVFIVCRNVSDSEMQVGHGVFYEYFSTEDDPYPGVDVKYPETTDNPTAFAGIVSDFPIPVGAIGLAQCYGYHPNVSFKGVVLSVFTSDEPHFLCPNLSATIGGAGYLESLYWRTADIPVGVLGGGVIPLAANGTTAGSSVPGFVKAL